jgi:uncharacterized tellurite resistance protein B-like protein
MSFAKFIDALQRRMKGPPSADTETVRKIVRALDQLPPERARHVAAFAYVLSRVARADMNITKAETKEMETLVAERGGLPEEQAALVVQIAKTQATLLGGTENFLVTEEFSKIAQHEEKIRLLHCLFAVAAADGSISNVEDREIRLIADELQLRHDEFVEVRLQYRDHLAVLRNHD